MARRRKGRMPVAGKIIILVGVLVGAYFLFTKTSILNSIAPQNANSTKSSLPKPHKRGKDDGIIDVGVVTWGGYAGGQYFNRGFSPNEMSEYYKQYGLQVKFHVIDNVRASMAAWESGHIDVHWTTIDAFPTQVEALRDFKPKVFFQSDWSRGGDAIVVAPGISTAQDLYGKKIAVAYMSPSHSFLLYVLDAADLSFTDVELVPVPSALDAAKMYLSGKVDAAVVWSPDDANCVKERTGTKVLMNTKTAKFIIADVFFARESFIQSHRSELKNLVEGWMKGAAEINTKNEARQQAAQILFQGFDGEVDLAFCTQALENVRLTTYGDNRRFFGLEEYSGVTGQSLYEMMTKKYRALNMCQSPAGWNEIIDVSILQSLSALASSPEHAAEGKATYTAPTRAMETQQAVTSKKVSVQFSTGSSTLTAEAKTIIDRKFGPILTMSGNRIRIEGNTDKTGSRQGNVSLSRMRAQSVAGYLSQKYGIDPNRFIIVGNGPDKPVCQEDTDACYAKNRRTEFQLLGE